jgi:hypothetical protein
MWYRVRFWVSSWLIGYPPSGDSDLGGSDNDAPGRGSAGEDVGGAAAGGAGPAALGGNGNRRRRRRAPRRRRGRRAAGAADAVAPAAPPAATGDTQLPGEASPLPSAVAAAAGVVTSERWAAAPSVGAVASDNVALVPCSGPPSHVDTVHGALLSGPCCGCERVPGLGSQWAAGAASVAGPA